MEKQNLEERVDNLEGRVENLEERVDGLEVNKINIKEIEKRCSLSEQERKMHGEQLQEHNITIKTFLAEERVRREKQQSMYNFVIPALLSGIVGIIVAIILKGV